LTGCESYYGYSYPPGWAGRHVPPAASAPAPTAAASSPAPAAPAPAASATAPAAIAAAESAMVSLDQCERSVSFSATPAAAADKGAPQPGTETSEYVYESGSYGEHAACTCKVDIDYSKLSQFDAVENTRRHVEKRGFTLEKAVFDDTLDAVKELNYEASGAHESNQSFLVGRNLYGECGLTVTATGTTYADFLRAKKFLASISSELVQKEQKEKSASAGYAATITTAGKTEETPPRKLEEAAAAETPAASGSTTTPAAAPDATTAPPGAVPAPPPAATAAVTPPAEKPAATVSPPPTAVRVQAQASADHPIAAPPPATVAARLLQLNELLEQKLITKAEYDERRRAILDSL
jgi:hypothetical protein